MRLLLALNVPTIQRMTGFLNEILPFSEYLLMEMFNAAVTFVTIMPGPYIAVPAITYQEQSHWRERRFNLGCVSWLRAPYDVM